MKSKNNSLQQQVKEQATRLSEYLGQNGHTLTRTLSIEAISRAVHGKPWNTVRTMANVDHAPAAGSQSVGSSYAYFSYTDHCGAVQPLSVVANLEFGSLTMGVNMNTTLQSLGDPLVRDLYAAKPAHWPEIYRVLESRAGGLMKGQTAEGTQFRFGTTFGDSFAVWLKAFRPQLLWSYIASKEFGGLTEAETAGFYADADPGQESRWLYRFAAEGSDFSFGSQLDAELALCERFGHGSQEWSHDSTWKSLVEVQAGSGQVEEVPSGHVSRVPGRADELTGATLFLQKGPLSGQELEHITDSGQYPVDVAIPLSLWDMVCNDLEWLNDEASERITGSICDLEDLGYERADAPEDLGALPAEQVWVRVNAQWSPSSPD